jgi:hypothetical protein
VGDYQSKYFAEHIREYKIEFFYVTHRKKVDQSFFAPWWKILLGNLSRKNILIDHRTRGCDQPFSGSLVRNFQHKKFLL